MNLPGGPNVFSWDTANTTEKVDSKPLVTACASCSEAHVKCDGNLPCSRCKLKEMACTYPKMRGRLWSPFLNSPL